MADINKLIATGAVKAEDFKPKDRIALLEQRFEKLLQMQGLSVKQIDDYQYEVIKPSFDPDNPIPYKDGMELVNNAFYLKDGKVYVWMNEWVEW